MVHDPTNPALQTLMVYSADDFVVTTGANLDDPLSFADELIFDDVYQIALDAQQIKLSLNMHAGDKTFSIGAGSDVGQEDNTVHLDCAITLMAPDGTTFDALIFVEVENDDAVGITFLPMAPIRPKTDYRLVGIDRKNPMQSLAISASVAFTKGTHITTATGQQVPIEQLRPGDKVLTRNDGPKEVLWVGEQTIRAVGEFAPIRIQEGALNNARDLVMSPDHRLFVYQRSDKLNAGRSQVLVKARKLINHDTVTRDEGGFVEYFHLLFDKHYIIYAEGIAAESMLIDERTQSALPEELSESVAFHSETRHQDIEFYDEEDQGDLAAKLKAASAG